MELLQLKHFYAVVTHGGFSKAARSLRLQQPSLSRAVKDLETELQVQLMNRDTRNVSLTEAGQRLYERCQKLFQWMDETPSIVKKGEAEYQGYFQFGCSDALVESVMPQVLESFSKKFPKVIPSIGTGIAGPMFLRIEAGELECGLFFGGPPRNLRLETNVLKKVPFYFAIAQTHRKNSETLKSYIAAREYEDGRSENSVEWKMLQEISPKADIRYSANSFLVHKAMVIRGLGISIFPHFLIKEELKSKKLIALNQDSPLEVELFLIKGNKRTLSPRANLLINLIKKVI